MKQNKTKLLTTLAIVGYTALVGSLGLGLGRHIERKDHKNDGITFVTRGNSSNPHLDITAKFGSEEVQFENVIENYARDLAPYGSDAARDYRNGSTNSFAEVVRYALRSPETFKAVQVGANWEASSVRVSPGRDTEFKYGLY